jgi:hypothetical protein
MGLSWVDVGLETQKRTAEAVRSVKLPGQMI